MKKKRSLRNKFTGKKRWVIVGGVVVLLVAGVAVHSAISDKNLSEDSKYRVTKVSQQTSFTLTGSVEPVQKEILDTPSGDIQSINVKNGEHVEQGQAILTTHNADKQDSVVEVQGEIDKSQRAMNSQQQSINNIKKQMSSVGSGNDGYSELQGQLTEAQNAYADAQASVNAAKNKLNTLSSKVNQTLTAPYAGYVEVDTSKQNQPVVTLYSDDRQVSAQISEYDYSKVKLGGNIQVKAVATNKVQETQISYLSEVPTKDSKGNNTKYDLNAKVDAKKFMLGQTVKMSVVQKGIKIPKAAVRDGKVYVVNKAGKAQATKVSGKEVNSYFIVDQGLVDSDKIVTNPDKDLKNNEQVENND